MGHGRREGGLTAPKNTILAGPAEVARVIKAAKEGFKVWLKLADEENVATCREVWDAHDADSCGCYMQGGSRE